MRSDFEEYMETGMVGAYCPDKTVLRKETNGIITVYRDTAYTSHDTHMDGQRVLMVGERSFFITAVFPTEAQCSPTDKLLKYIDADMGKSAERA
ncbi:MAG: hypothetical protein NC319_06645 [Butyricicoccus sp.]|nr:hypothetical protein [Butyricicoccus sp.]